VDHNLNILQWIGNGGASDHFPIFLELQEGRSKPPSPLKFNKIWLKDPTFFELVKIIWEPFLHRGDLSSSFHFAKNISRIKKSIKAWAQAKLSRDDQELKQIEESLVGIYDEEGGGHLNSSAKEILSGLEGRRNTLLREREESWRLKSRALWVKSGDDNTKFFHAYAKGRKSLNTIWKLSNPEGEEVNSFEGMAIEGVRHFRELFKESD